MMATFGAVNAEYVPEADNQELEAARTVHCPRSQGQHPAMPTRCEKMGQACWSIAFVASRG